MKIMNSQEESPSNSELVLLKSLIAEHKYASLYGDILDDELLLGFLRGRKWNTASAFDYLLVFLHVRTKKYKDFTRSHLPSSLTTLWEVGKVKILRNMDPTGHVVGFDQIKLWNASVHNIQEIIAEIVLHIDELMRSTSIRSKDGNRAIVIFNFEGVCLAHAKQLRPRTLIQLLDMFQNSIPIRPAAIHVLNEGRIVRGFYNVIKPMLKEKIRNRIHFHSSDLSSLHGHVPPSILPKCLGGELTDEEAYEDAIVPKICSREEFYKQLGQL